ncbi:MAG: hypothetical protein R3223_12035, partial [Longimicrobiales bacterium]|nr:hypothetical protein [Longimicrobiales bacterium]
MNSDSPGWQTVDPTGTSSAAALPEPPSPGELLIFASVASADDRAWAGGTVAEIAREWAGSVERLLLMDLDLQGPGIHDAVEAEPAEGATDVLLFGASISRVTQPVEEGRFHFSPAGTPVADPRVILSNNRWERVLQGCRDAGISLVVHLPLDQPGAESLLSRADRIIRLGRPVGDGEKGIPSELDDRVVAALVPSDVPGESVVEIADLAPDEPVVEIEDLAPEPAEEPVVDIAELAPDEPVEEAGEALAAATEEAASESREKAPGPGPIVDITDLAPDEPVGVARPPEEGLGIPEDHAGVEDLPADFPEEPSPEAEVEQDVVPFGPETGDVEETAPLEATEGFEEPVDEAGLESEEEIADEGRVRDEEGVFSEAGEALEAAAEEAAFEGRREAPGPGPVVDIADLAPDEPVGIDRPVEEGIGVPEDPFGVEDEPAEFPEEPSPEATADEQVVPFGPETGEVEE